MASSSGTAGSTEPPPETGSWTRFLPEAFGIRQNIQESPFRWCVRESAMWGIATGTAMSIHRLRMGSNPFFAVNVGFATTLLVTVPSYYFCFRRREHKYKVIELMMKANDFQTHEEMPAEPKIKEHPFLKDDNETKLTNKEYQGYLKERKEWQTPTPTQDAADVFKEVKGSPPSKSS
mmetsp:Transcript_24120/g.28938  ORF Transcript_24120/g.28938 Transcript_24120/m.28938 type:complete len:177 (-) Transcript_24120:269-799(-)